MIKSRKFVIFIVLSIAYCFISYYGTFKHLNNSATLRRKSHSKTMNESQHKNFYVIANIYNPASFKSRYESYWKFYDHIQSFGVQLITVELVFGDQDFQVTDSNDPNNIQLRTNDAMWYKENLINIAIKRLPPECEYVAWIDLEVEFMNKNWVHDTIRALNKYKIVQLFEVVNILGPNHEIVEANAGYGYCFMTRDTHGVDIEPYLRSKYDVSFKHLKRGGKRRIYCSSGYGWAAKPSTILKIGGLFDKGIIGDGDYIIAYSHAGRKFPSDYKFLSEHFSKAIDEFRSITDQHINKSMGFIPGAINHLWHGSITNRNYIERRKILSSHQIVYNPKEDLYYDKDGLLHFKKEISDKYTSLIRKYFEGRKEDSS